MRIDDTSLTSDIVVEPRPEDDLWGFQSVKTARGMHLSWLYSLFLLLPPPLKIAVCSGMCLKGGRKAERISRKEGEQREYGTWTQENCAEGLLLWGLSGRVLVLVTVTWVLSYDSISAAHVLLSPVLSVSTIRLKWESGISDLGTSAYCQIFPECCAAVWGCSSSELLPIVAY